MIPLPDLEDVIDRSGVAAQIELLLPIGARPRQLRVGTLLASLFNLLCEQGPEIPV